MIPTLPSWAIWVAVASIVIGMQAIVLSVAYAIGRADEHAQHVADLDRRDRCSRLAQ